MQSYKTANQSDIVGLAGSNSANEYLRYKEELDRQRREQEAARKKAQGGWLKRGLVNAGTGALTGFLASGFNPAGAAIGAAGGFGLSALGDAAGMNSLSYGGGGGQLAGMASGTAYKNYIANKPTGMGGFSPEGSAGFMGPPSPGEFDYSSGYMGSNPAYYDPRRARIA